MSKVHFMKENIKLDYLLSVVSDYLDLDANVYMGLKEEKDNNKKRCNY